MSSSDARRVAFAKELRELRQTHARRLDPKEVVRLARQAGLTRQETLRELRSQDARRYVTSGEMEDALPIFVSALCGRSKTGHVLEYVCNTSLLTAYVPEELDSQQLTFVTPDTAVAEVLRELVERTSAAVVLGIDGIPSGVEYDVIVCQPVFGHRPAGNGTADGFGGEVIRALVPFLAGQGTLYWVTGRGVLWAPRVKQTLTALQAEGLNNVATIDVAAGAFPGAMVEEAVVALRRVAAGKRFVGAIRDLETAEPIASAFLAGPTRKSGPSWAWLDAEDDRTFANLERTHMLQRLMPRGRHAIVSLGSLLKSQDVVRADRSIADGDQTAAFLFVPEYAGSRVTADLADQTVNSKAVYRLTIDTSKANPRFVAQLLNSPYGKHVRESAAHGATIQRTSVPSLLSLELPIPDMATQDRIARIDADIGLMRAAFRDMQSALDQDWTVLSEVAEKTDALKGVLDIERQISDWWRELPYPLATIYRRYQVSTEPKERFETLLHFFEMTAVYLAAIGTSHVRIMRADWQVAMGRWLHPPGTAGIERADFGFWIGLARASLKDTSRIASDKDLRAIALELVGPELVQIAGTIGSLGRATDVLDVARRYRNSWKGHGGHLKASDAARLGVELQQSVRDFYEITASLFRRLQLVRPGLAEVTDTGMKFQIERLAGSDPTFERLQVELDRAAKSNALAFWIVGARTMCRTLPFFRLGAPQQPQETSCYVFNRVETGGCRWISYQEAREQEFVAPDDELLDLIALGTPTR